MFKFKRKPTDEQMESMQFGICDNAPKKMRKSPNFISGYFSFILNFVEEVSSKMNEGAETYIQRNY